MRKYTIFYLSNFALTLQSRKQPEVARTLLKSGLIVTTCRLQTCYNLLKQRATSLWIKSFDNQLATSLLTTCNMFLVGIICLLITRTVAKSINRLVVTLRVGTELHQENWNWGKRWQRRESVSLLQPPSTTF